MREQQLSATIAELRSKSEDDDTLSNIELQLEEKRTEESRLRKDVSNKKKEVSTLADTISKVRPSAIQMSICPSLCPPQTLGHTLPF